MRVTKITVTFGGKVPTVQYGNVDMVISREVELLSGDDAAQVTTETFQAVKQAVIAEVQTLPEYAGRSWLRSIGVNAPVHKPVPVIEEGFEDDFEDDADYEDEDELAL